MLLARLNSTHNTHAHNPHTLVDPEIIERKFKFLKQLTRRVWMLFRVQFGSISYTLVSLLSAHSNFHVFMARWKSFVSVSVIGRHIRIKAEWCMQIPLLHSIVLSHLALIYSYTKRSREFLASYTFNVLFRVMHTPTEKAKTTNNNNQ